MLLEYCEGGELGRILFGLPFLGVGCFAIWAFLFRGIPALFESPPRGREWLIVPLVFLIPLINGVAFSAAGVLFIFGRNGTVFDKEAATVTLWWSMPFIKRSVCHGTKDFTNVVVRRTGGSFRTGPTYSVILTGPDRSDLDVAQVKVCQEKAESLADEIANFLGLSRTDTTSQPSG